MIPLIATAVVIFAGLMITRVFKLLHLNFPDVTAFLLAGILVGPFCLGRLGVPGLGFNSLGEIEGYSILTSAALGFIAFSIGSEFKLSKLKETGKQATVIGILQAVAATLLVDIVLVVLHFVLGEDVLPLPVCIVLGAIAAATAPAATLMVVRQYKAKGPLTDLLLPIVALDDAVGLVIFAVSFGIAQAVKGGQLNFVSIVVNPIIEILCSVLLGSVMALIMTQLEKLFFSNSNRLAITISFVFLTIALSSLKFEIGEVRISFSSLLVCMMLGTVFCNTSKYSEDIFGRCDKWTVPLYAAFFVISGAQLDLSVLAKPAVLLVGIVYIITRCLGKYLGATLSAKAMKCPEKTVKHLGVTLFPQAGVALGMVATSAALGDAEAEIIRNVVLFSVMVYELVGPSLTKIALTKAGEITPAGAEKKSRDRFAAQGKVS